MSLLNAEIKARLQQEILHLQGYKPAGDSNAFDGGLGIIRHAFPNSRFPLGAMHEFFCSNAEDTSATSGFISGIISALMKKSGVAMWISNKQHIFPPALQAFGVQPDNIIFVDVRNEKEKLWVVEEALKCTALAAVIADVQEVSFTSSRRFQLAVEQSKVTGFLLRNNPKNTASACVSRWKITPVATEQIEDMPGLGFPRWNAELLKVRNGKPGVWQLQWSGGKFQHMYKLAAISNPMQQRKAV